MAGIDSFNPLLYSQSAAALEAAKKSKKEEEKSQRSEPKDEGQAVSSK